MEQQQHFEERKKRVYALICDPHYIPMKIREIAILMQVTKEDRPELDAVLQALLDEGKITLSKRGKYKKAETILVTGTFLGHARGFGFVRVEDRADDIFIPEKHTAGAMHQDTVEVEVLPDLTGKRQEGIVRRILAHGVTELVGTFEKKKNFGFVIPDNERITADIYVPLERSKGAEQGHKVLVELTDYGDERHHPEGKITKILGHRREPGVDVLSIAYEHEIPMEFPEKVLNQAERMAKPVSEADLQGREDLRELTVVTIDGEDAKDLDDGVSLSRDEETGLWHLGVHIADVSNYVQENSALDREALKRGTSVYLTDRVIPMLPRALSNGICSLNQGEDRLTLSCLLDIDAKGVVVSHRIVESVIRVDRRMTYTAVNRILTEESCSERQEYRELVPLFFEMAQLSGILRERRRKRGSIDFDFPESKIRIDESGKAVEILPCERNAATNLIEDFMLAANETVAEDYFWQDLPFLYRTHEAPDPDRIARLSSIIANFGYGLKGSREEVHPRELQKLLERIADTPEQNLISRLVLRSMRQAKYTVACTGHFGLAAKYYCHFTSPIRRYPDLQIHRIIREQLRGRLEEDRITHYEAILPGIATQVSLTERRAEEAERENEKMKKAEYMCRHIGEVFTGVISGMNQYGFYVELSNTVEGMVHVSNLPDDHYEYNEAAWELRGVHTGRTFRIGQWVTIEVLDADPDTRMIDFIVRNQEEEGERESNSGAEGKTKH